MQFLLFILAIEFSWKVYTQNIINFYFFSRSLRLKMYLIILLLFSSITPSVLVSLPNLAKQRKMCSQRCHRILQRSLEGAEETLSVEVTLHRIDAFRREQLLLGVQKGSTSPAEELALPKQLKTICWRFFDFEDCSRQCERTFFRRRKKRKTGTTTRAGGKIGTEHRQILNFCHRNDFGVPYGHFACVHKYHAFVEIRCSSYQQKAVELRLLALQLRQQPAELIGAEQFGGDLGQMLTAIDQEVCLLLHQHSACLANALFRHCPRSRSLFSSRHSLRHNFLSLILPFGTALDRRAENNAKDGANLNGSIELDPLFSDAMLDTCQLMDFKKMAELWKEREEKTESEGRSTTKRWTTRPNKDKTPVGMVEVTVAPSGRRVFSSDEDLLDVPPNFHYSTARLPPDFYTRYAIWWGGRRKEQPNQQRHTDSPVVKLLPEEPKVAEQHTKWPHQQHTEMSTTPIRTMQETRPDPTPIPTQRARLRWEQNADLGATLPYIVNGQNADMRVTLPYIVNGHVTEPRERWRTEEEEELMGRRKTTEVHLLGDGEAKTRRPIMVQQESAMPGKMLPNEGDTWSRVISREDEDEGEGNSVEQIIRQMDDGKAKGGGESPPRDAKNPWSGRTISPNQEPTPFLRDTSVYFAKILEFEDEEKAPETTMDRDKGTRGETTPAWSTAEQPSIVAQMVHYPREQLTPTGRRMEQGDADRSVGPEPKSANEAISDAEKVDDDEYDDELLWYTKVPVPYEIKTANPDEWTMITPAGMADLSQKTRVPLDHPAQSPDLATSTPKILISAEPVPRAHSDTLLVLLGLYLTFFGLASFLLLCLVLACVERRRRRRTAIWWDQSKRKKAGGGKYREGGDAGGGIQLVLNERKGTRISRIHGGRRIQ